MLSDFIIRHSLILAESYQQVTCQQLIGEYITGEELAQKLYQAPFVLLSHGTEQDPVFNYANVTAQKLWNLDWEAFTNLPSRLSAEPMAVEERQAMLKEAREKGFISNYTGIRVSSTGHRFLIKDALLWNNLDEEGGYLGQAAVFKSWQHL